MGIMHAVVLVVADERRAPRREHPDDRVRRAPDADGAADRVVGAEEARRDGLPDDAHLGLEELVALGPVRRPSPSRTGGSGSTASVVADEGRRPVLVAVDDLPLRRQPRRDAGDAHGLARDGAAVALGEAADASAAGAGGLRRLRARRRARSRRSCRSRCRSSRWCSRRAAVTMTTAVMPMRMPSTVSAARILLRAMAPSARRNAPRKVAITAASERTRAISAGADRRSTPIARSAKTAVRPSVRAPPEAQTAPLVRADAYVQSASGMETATSAERVRDRKAQPLATASAARPAPDAPEPRADEGLEHDAAHEREPTMSARPRPSWRRFRAPAPPSVAAQHGRVDDEARRGPRHRFVESRRFVHVSASG